MGRELNAVRNKKQKLLEKRSTIDEELKLLSLREEELENEEVITVFRKANITLEELMAKFKEHKKQECIQRTSKENTEFYAEEINYEETQE